ncbi:MAG: hypothetical protein VXZ15_12170, partial [Planctomycetota bacterium]|nr:hypothetical protein [Planctomycetota bacterium]
AAFPRIKRGGGAMPLVGSNSLRIHCEFTAICLRSACDLPAICLRGLPFIHRACGDPQYPQVGPIIRKCHGITESLIG